MSDEHEESDFPDVDMTPPTCHLCDQAARVICVTCDDIFCEGHSAEHHHQTVEA